MQHLGLLSFITLLVGLVFTATKLSGGLSKTFSQRVANNRSAEILYSLLFIATLPLLYTFFVIWFVPSLNLPQYFLFFTAIAIVFQVLCTWVPERGGRMTAVHRVLTGISGIALLPMIFIVANAQSISIGIRVIGWLVLSGMTILLIVALRHQKGFRYALLLQIGYYSLFFIAILSATYIQ